MDKEALIAQLQQEMRQLPNDIQAEPLLALALEKGLNREDYIIHCDRLFYREYSRDVTGTELKEDAWKKWVLQVHLSRSGIYDQLPEGLFFSPARSGVYTAADMASDYRLNRQKEEAIRRFFLPFDQAFFEQRLQLELEESRLLEELQQGRLNDFFMQLWNIPTGIPQLFIVPLFMLLPYAHKIAGNDEATALALQGLLREPVHIRRVQAAPAAISPSLQLGLGQQQLGVNWVCGTTFTEDVPAVECIIGPLGHSTISSYLPGGNYQELLETFFSYCIPAGMEVQLTIEVPHEEKNMQLSRQPVLGYSSMLGNLKP